jgi:F0F1-type ATP synthase membrane subunit b/b'
MLDFTPFEWTVVILLLLLIAAIYRATAKISKRIEEKADEILRELETPESVRQEQHDEQALLDEAEIRTLASKATEK